MKHVAMVAAIMAFGATVPAFATQELAPYGSAKPIGVQYKKLKVALNLLGTPESAKGNMAQLAGVLKQFGAGAPKGSEIEVVVIGGVVGAFAKENFEAFQPQIDAIADMVKNGSGGTSVKVVLCGNSINNAGYKIEDMHGFATVAPAGYIELGRLSQLGYAITQVENVKTKDARFVFRPDLKPAVAAAAPAAAAPKAN